MEEPAGRTASVALIEPYKAKASLLYLLIGRVQFDLGHLAIGVREGRPDANQILTHRPKWN
ncbi:MAG: hypothetical protein J6N54_06430 [Bacteroidales bacterium]|nr:hypothetical protein [Bacteroidales bacterium]